MGIVLVSFVSCMTVIGAVRKMDKLNLNSIYFWLYSILFGIGMSVFRQAQEIVNIWNG